jgi:hypothetical protein
MFCGFREEDENMKSLQTRTTTMDAVMKVMTKAHLRQVS